MDDNLTRDDTLQFDTLAPIAGEHAGTPATAGVTCIGCGRTITDTYFDINGKPACSACHTHIGQSAESARAWSVFGRALAMGLAAVLGAVLYYAVIAITNYEIGIVAIAIGYMVGYGIKMGARGVGGRRFQVAAVLLTYWAVGLAYTPLAFREMSAAADPAAQEVATPDGVGAAASPAAPATDRAIGVDGRSVAPTPAQFNVGVAVLILAAMTFVLPVLSVVGSMPGGLISGLIIGFGMRQAWQMTAAPPLQITGPFRIAPSPPPSA